MFVESEINDFYKGRTVFITGASGFMGKVLLEKLLYGCPSISRIYILLRQRKYVSITSRLDAMLRLPVFNRVRSTDPLLLKKVIAINGDVASPNLGLDVKDKTRLIEEVSVVFHCAASLKLEGKLKELVNINLAGTERVIQLCYEIPRLKTLIHLSTAFCHVDIDEMKETIYSSEVDPEEIIRMTQWLDDDTIEIITPRLLGPHPNCYTYTKRLAESLVDKHYPRLPVSVVRPCIVTPAWKEPLPGWVDNLNGPMGLLVGGGKGVIRTMRCRADYVAEVIPVDYAINAIISFSRLTSTSQDRFDETPVLNITESKTIPLTWNDIMERGKKACREDPFEMLLWYPGGSIHSSWIIHTLCVIFFHWLPALLIDLCMVILRQKTFMLRIQRKITEGITVLQYFTTKQWIIHSEILNELKSSMSEQDKRAFPLTTDGFDINEYIRNCVLGARHYLMKEDPKTLPRQRNIIKLLYIMDKTVKCMFYIFIVYNVFNYTAVIKNIFVPMKYNAPITASWTSSPPFSL